MLNIISYHYKFNVYVSFNSCKQIYKLYNLYRVKLKFSDFKQINNKCPSETIWLTPNLIPRDFRCTNTSTMSGIQCFWTF
jgi:hypothetical protein